MKKLTDKLFQDFWRIDGARFKASMVDSPTYVLQNGAYPPRLLLVKLPSFIVPGTTIKNARGDIFLLLQYPTTQAGCKSFRAVQATESFKWERRIDIIDTVSQMPKSYTIDPKGTLYGTYQNLAGDKFEGFTISKKSFWTGQSVSVNDLVDDCPVIKVQEAFGAYLVTVR